MPHHNSTPDGDQQSSSIKRHHLETEMVIYQSDRSKFLRKKEALDLEIRTLKKKLEEDRVLLLGKEEETRKLLRDLEMVESELLRLRKKFNTL
ncbi:MAG: hypothetical protein ABI747_04395 [Candidatus Moraniibacteriota bacterium]